MTPKSFDQWKMENADMLAELEDEYTECRRCRGSGDHECDCGDIHDCSRCQGAGRILRDKAMELYQKYLDADKTKMERWGREPIKA